MRIDRTLAQKEDSMSVYAIGDLHLPGRSEKPMDVFGSQWDKHFDIISKNWIQNICPQDIVLIPGDISWAMQLENALDDLNAINALPGRKLLIRGNHDYWWSTISKVRGVLRDGMHALQNDAVSFDGNAFCGTRGWMMPTQAQTLDEQDEKVYKRELTRLNLSLEAANRYDEPITVMMHYPPLLGDGEDTDFTRIIEQFPVKQVVYGHLHGAGIKHAFSGEKNGVCYRLVSCDAIGFSPVKLY